MKNSKLYLILDTEVKTYAQLLRIAQEAVHGGVDILQIRDKKGSAENILRFTRCLKSILPEGIPLILNDRVELVKEAGAAGVHIGQEDLSIDEARQNLGPQAIIGVSCQTLAHALDAQKAGADYIGLGSVFKTQTKPDRSPMDLKGLSDILKEMHIPVFAIGGITQNNIGELIQRGVNRVAVCRAICCAPSVEEEVRSLKKNFEIVKVSAR